VHLRGTLHALPEDALQPHVESLSAEHETRLLPKTPWRTDKMSEGTLPRMMRMILPYRFQITAIEGTWKLGQNKTPEIRAHAAEALSHQPDANAQAIATLMRQLG
jgi:transcriptional regulator